MKIKTHLDNLNYYKIYLKIIQAIDKFLESRSYLKIDLPILSPVLIPESYLEVFETEFQYLGRKEKLYLAPSPELFLKRLLTKGIGNCYYLGKSFRNNEPNSPLHSFEFTMLEYYKVGVDYMGLEEELLEMLRDIKQKVKSQKAKGKNTNQNLKIKYQNKEISLEKWEKISVAEAFKKYAKISEKDLFNYQRFIRRAKEKGYKIGSFNYEELWSQIYVQEVEPHLGMNGYPTLIYDYPKEFAALAKLNQDGKTAQRFEFYIAGIELGDCYSELTDWREQNLRFKQAVVCHPIDKGFIEALKYGLPECAGIAIGLERLAMIFSDADAIDKFKLITIS